jgi:NADH-quinone oxidoreductase subunit G
VQGEYFSAAPPAGDRRDGEWRIVPLHHIFGSEELSVLAPAVGELVPGPYLALGESDAARLGVAEGEAITIIPAEGDQLRLPIRIATGLAPGIAGLPIGLPGTPSAASLIDAQSVRLSAGES